MVLMLLAAQTLVTFRALAQSKTPQNDDKKKKKETWYTHFHDCHGRRIAAQIICQEIS